MEQCSQVWVRQFILHLTLGDYVCSSSNDFWIWRVMRRSTAQAAQLFFYVFATLIGVSLSSIFIFYTTFSITQTFLVTAIAFAGLSLWGYTTKKDISGWGSFLIMGVIGLIVAMVINIFIGPA